MKLSGVDERSGVGRHTVNGELDHSGGVSVWGQAAPGMSLKCISSGSYPALVDANCTDIPKKYIVAQLTWGRRKASSAPRRFSA